MYNTSRITFTFELLYTLPRCLHVLVQNAELYRLSVTYRLRCRKLFMYYVCPLLKSRLYIMLILNTNIIHPKADFDSIKIKGLSLYHVSFFLQSKSNVHSKEVFHFHHYIRDMYLKDMIKDKTEQCMFLFLFVNRLLLFFTSLTYFLTTFTFKRFCDIIKIKGVMYKRQKCQKHLRIMFLSAFK